MVPGGFGPGFDGGQSDAVEASVPLAGEKQSFTIQAADASGRIHLRTITVEPQE